MTEGRRQSDDPLLAHADFCPIRCKGGCDDCLGQLGCIPLTPDSGSSW